MILSRGRGLSFPSTRILKEVPMKHTPLALPSSAAETSKSRRRKKSLNPRSIFWQILRSFKVTGSMPSWALPIETITAWMFLGDRQKKRRSRSDESLERDGGMTDLRGDGFFDAAVGDDPHQCDQAIQGESDPAEPESHDNRGRVNHDGDLPFEIVANRHRQRRLFAVVPD